MKIYITLQTNASAEHSYPKPGGINSNFTSCGEKSRLPLTSYDIVVGRWTSIIWTLLQMICIHEPS